MFDSISAFKNQFFRIEGGYVYYPSSKSGGKLITQQEFEKLVEDWQRVSGTKGTLKSAGITILVIAVWIFISTMLNLPEMASSIATVIIVASLSSWITWHSIAPRRLVRGRPDFMPPRTPNEARRQALSVLNWPFILFALFVSGIFFSAGFDGSDRSPLQWAGWIGSGLFFATYLWIGWKKLRDH